MKRIFSIMLLLATVSTAVAWAQNKTGELTFENKVHDFGMFSEDEGTVTCKFKFTNTGNAPVVIIRVTASCGCTTPEYPCEPIAPGKSGEITVTYDAEGRPGSFQKNVNVYSSGEPAKVMLVIKGAVMEGKESNYPSYIFQMGDLKLKTTHMAFMDTYTGRLKGVRLPVVNVGKESLRLYFEDVPKHIAVEANPGVLGPGEFGEIVAVYNADKVKDWGIRQDAFFVKFRNNDKTDLKNRITVSANIMETLPEATPDDPEISVSENKIDFDKIKESKVSRQITIKNSGKSTLKIHKITANAEYVDVSFGKSVLQAGKSAVMNVTVDSDKMPGKVLNSKITIISNDPSNQVYVLRVLGMVG